MDLPAGTMEDSRANMVDGQLRPNRVTDRAVLAAMRALPRERFLLPRDAARAYADAEVEVADGRRTFSPMVLARLVQAAAVRPGMKVLVLGAGYAAAVLAHCGAAVTVVEPDANTAARTVAAAPGLSIAIHAGPLPAGFAAGAPYDLIFIDGAVRALPPLAAQLATAPPGRLAAVLVGQGRTGTAILAEAVAGALVPRTLFDCSATPIPAFDPAETFRF